MSPPDMLISGRDIGKDNMMGVNVIDYALKQALPDSRPTTIMSFMPKATVTVSGRQIEQIWWILLI